METQECPPPMSETQECPPPISETSMVGPWEALSEIQEHPPLNTKHVAWWAPWEAVSDVQARPPLTQKTSTVSPQAPVGSLNSIQDQKGVL
jgi:hypothetical protein